MTSELTKEKQNKRRFLQVKNLTQMSEVFDVNVPSPPYNLKAFNENLQTICSNYGIYDGTLYFINNKNKNMFLTKSDVKHSDYYSTVITDNKITGYLSFKSLITKIIYKLLSILNDRTTFKCSSSYTVANAMNPTVTKTSFYNNLHGSNPVFNLDDCFRIIRTWLQLNKFATEIHIIGNFNILPSIEFSHSNIIDWPNFFEDDIIETIEKVNNSYYFTCIGDNNDINFSCIDFTDESLLSTKNNNIEEALADGLLCGGEDLKCSINLVKLGQIMGGFESSYYKKNYHLFFIIVPSFITGFRINNNIGMGWGNDNHMLYPSNNLYGSYKNDYYNYYNSALFELSINDTQTADTDNQGDSDILRDWDVNDVYFNLNNTINFWYHAHDNKYYYIQVN